MRKSSIAIVILVGIICMSVGGILGFLIGNGTFQNDVIENDEIENDIIGLYHLFDGSTLELCEDGKFHWKLQWWEINNLGLVTVEGKWSIEGDMVYLQWYRRDRNVDLGNPIEAIITSDGLLIDGNLYDKIK